MALVVITDRESIKRRILNFVETYSGLPAERVTWAEQNAEKRDLPMATIQIVSDGLKFGQDETLDDFNEAGPDLTRATRGPRRLTATINCYSATQPDLATKDAMDYLLDLISVLTVPLVIEENRAACVSITELSPVTDISSIVGERWERRATVDLSVMYVAGTEQAGLTDAWIDTITPIEVSNGNLELNE